MWMEGQTDMTKLIVAFHSFANVPKEIGKEPLRWPRHRQTDGGRYDTTKKT